MPGQQYFAGTHLNPNVTWWEKSAPFFAYINRCQSMLQQGLPVADVAYYYGDHVPNFTQLRSSDPARVGAGYDYDVLTAEAILTRLRVKDGRLVLAGRRELSPAGAAGPGHHLAAGAAQTEGTRARRGRRSSGRGRRASISLKNFPRNDAEVKGLAEELWAGKTGKGRVITGRTAREVLLADGVQPDFEFRTGQTEKPDISFIHRSTGEAEIYFVANRSTNAVRCKPCSVSAARRPSCGTR